MGLAEARETAQVPRVTVIELVAFVFAMFTLYGCGAEPVLYGLVLLLLAYLSLSGSGGAQEFQPSSISRQPRQSGRIVIDP
jgi:hypothetical protein